MTSENDSLNGYSMQGSINIAFKIESTMSIAFLNAAKLRSDIDFLVEQYRDERNNPESKKVYARSSIIMAAFYFECLGSTLFTVSDSSWEEPTREYSHISKPIRKFIAFYKANNDGTLQLDYLGVQDLFHIRNKVFAHAPEATTTSSNNHEKLTRLCYQKFSSYPHSYVEFSEEHAEELLNEVTEFLAAFTQLMRDSLPDWWVRKFIN